MNLPLPPYGNQLEVPKYNAATNATDAQSADGAAVTSNQPSAATLLTANVATISGFVDCPRQQVERGLPGTDTVVFKDLMKDCNRKLDLYCLSGSGSSGIPQGITASSPASVTFTTTLSVTSFWARLADAVQRVQTAVQESPDGIVMHPRRLGWLLAWLLAQVDSSGRPLLVTNQSGPQNATGVINGQTPPFGQRDSSEVTVRPAGWLMGIPVYPDSNVTTTDGASTNADQILVGSFKNAILWEAGSPREFTFDGVASANVNLRLQLVHYAAFLTRIPTAFALISGTSLGPPNFAI